MDFRLTLDVPEFFSVETVDDIVTDEGSDLRDRLRREWPVETGRSRRAWTYHESPEGWTVENRVRYTGFIRDGRASVSETRIPYAIERTARQTADRLADALPQLILQEVAHG